MLEKVLDKTVLWKEWTLLAFCVIGIVSTIVISGVSLAIIDSIDNDISNHTEAAVTSATVAKNSAKTMIIVSTIITILVDVMAFVGGYKSGYFMTLTYIMLMVLIGLGSVLIAIRTECWYPTVFHFLILGLAYDMRLIKNKAFSHRNTQLEKELEYQRHKYHHHAAPVVVVTCGNNQPYVTSMGASEPSDANSRYIVNMEPLSGVEKQYYQLPVWTPSPAQTRRIQ
ncbi:unnamed protein product [Medioppia subpectinata]|uniref:Uncharacterized protein n=1 Tax=Medioppia subpectinata TaxID=1979941 RepID=A0A7R9LQT8_9ACAR|nr:unnamed protein product [Medioppia subpectinata]CAG2120304.1 unnamed protein product [Medioppia subpectinata]